MAPLDNLEDTITVAPPGTVKLYQDESNKQHEESLIHASTTSNVVLQPQPSSDPNDPLNWSSWRKAVNITLAYLYTLWVYTILDIGTVTYGVWNAELGISYQNLSNSYAANTASLAVGGIILIPLTLKFGRRPMYLGTSLVLTLGAVWSAKQRVLSDFIGSNIISGFAGAVGDAIVQLTISDMFFVHQRGTFNGIYVLMVNLGVFAAPIASGYILESQGWPWMYWYCVIFTGATFVAMVFVYEETKYTTPVISASNVPHQGQFTISEAHKLPVVSETGAKKLLRQVTTNRSVADTTAYGEETSTKNWIDGSIPMKSYRQRLALVTTSPGTFLEFLKLMTRPFIYLYCFPAVAYTAIQYGCVLSFFAVLGNSQAPLFSAPPYNFGPATLGLMSVPALIGAIIGSAYGGPLSDWAIVWLSKRNGGTYEPEFRLYMCLLPAFVGPCGILLYGIGAARGLPWIVPFIGISFAGFALASISNLSLVYLYDSYLDILGGALVAVTVVRNGLATVIVFAFNPWVTSMGYQNTFVLCGALGLFLNLLAVPMIIWGKTFRTRLADKYRRYATDDAGHSLERM